MTPDDQAFISSFLDPITLDWQHAAPRDLLLVQDLPVLCRFDEPVLFALPRADAMLVSGFSIPEPDRRWTDGPIARLRLRHQPSATPIAINIHVVDAHTMPNVGCPVDVSLNGTFVGTSIFANGPAQHAVFLSEEIMRPDRMIDIELRIHDPSQPQPGKETRALGLAAVAITLQQTA